MKIFPEYGSFTLLPEGYPVTSTYLVGSEGLNTYPGLFGTGFATGNCADSGFGVAWAVCLTVVASGEADAVVLCSVTWRGGVGLGDGATGVPGVVTSAVAGAGLGW